MRLAVVFTLLLTSFSAGSIELTFATDDTETFPFYMGADTVREKDPGVAIEIMSQAAKELGITIKFIRMPWKRALASMGNNLVDGAFNASFEQKRKLLGRYPEIEGRVDQSRRIATIRHAFYKLQRSPADWDSKRFNGLTSLVGVVHSYSIADDLRKMEVPIDTAISPQANLDKLILGRVEVIIGSESKMDSMLAKDPEKYQKVVKLDRPFKVKPTYLMLSHSFVKNNPELAEKLWTAVGKIGAGDDIWERYIHYFAAY